MDNRRFSAAAAFVGILIITACASGPSTDPFDQSAGSVSIEVQNHNFLDATIYAIAPGVRRRLGTVTGKGEDVFNLRWDFAQPLRLTIDLLASGSCTTRELLVNPGEIVQLVVESNLDSDPDCR